MNHQQLTPCNSFNVFEALYIMAVEQHFRIATGEGEDHVLIILRATDSVKRNLFGMSLKQRLGRPCKDMNDLKRSFVGAVNRRLRTVVGNRSAVLFSSDRERQKIRLLPIAASALRQTMEIPEPEILDFHDSADFDDVLNDGTSLLGQLSQHVHRGL